jgi:hypothetical protein
MDHTRDFVLIHINSDRTAIQLREKVSGAELAFAIKADGTLGELFEVAPLGLTEHRSGPPIDVDDDQAVLALVAKARKAAENFLAHTP